MPRVSHVPKLGRLFGLFAVAFYIVSILLLPQSALAQSNGLDYYLGGNASYGPTTGNNPGGGGGTPGAGGSVDPSDYSQLPPGGMDGVGESVPTPTIQVTHGTCSTDTINALLHCFVINTFGNLVGIAGSALNFAVTHFIIGFGNLYLGTTLGTTLEDLWGTVRDIFNLTFIFGLVYIGFQIILGVNDTQAKRTIPYLILAALLVNFSLFIVKLIIDFSNFAAAQIYQIFESSSGGAPDLGTAFVRILDIATLMSSQGTDVPFLYIIGILLVFLVVFYVFLSATILITIRFISLCYYLVLSPIMFLGWVFPGLGKYTKDFWSGLLGQAFFAPALLFLLYLSYRVMAEFSENDTLRRGLVAANSTAGAGSVPETTANFVGIIPFFILTIGFIVASLVVAKKMGAVGASASINFGNRLRGYGQSFVGGATLGTAAFAGRGTVGRLGNKLADSDNLKDAASKRGVGGFMARRVLNTANVAATASFDARQIDGVGKKLGIGEGAKGGYRKMLEETAKKDQKYAEMLGLVGDDDVLVKARIKERDAADLILRETKKSGTPQQIKEAETALADANRKVEQEKRRRVLGSTFADGETERFENDKKKAEKTLKSLWTTYNEQSNEALKLAFLNAHRAQMSDLEKQIADAKEKIRLVGSGNNGYVNVLAANDTLGRASSWLSGRSWKQSNYSSKELKKKYEKATKKSKDDIYNDSLVDAIKSSAK